MASAPDLERENTKLKQQRDELLEAIDYILNSSTTFLSNTAIEKAQAAARNAMQQQ